MHAKQAKADEEAASSANRMLNAAGAALKHLSAGSDLDPGSAQRNNPSVASRSRSAI
jgi:capsid protein